MFGLEGVGAWLRGWVGVWFRGCGVYLVSWCGRLV